MQTQNSMGYADIHMHTTASDGLADVRELLEFISVKHPYFDVIAITDHDKMEASLWAYEHRHLYSFDIIPGVEISSAEGDILALWVTTPIKRDMSMVETVIAIHEAGGVAILAHPLHPFVPRHPQLALRLLRDPYLLLRSGLDAVETYNAGLHGTMTNAFAAVFARLNHLPITGGSDAHTLGSLGTGFTRFPGHTADDLRCAIRNRQTVVGGSGWPFREYRTYLQHESERKAALNRAQ